MKVTEKRHPSCLGAAGAERPDASQHKPPVWPAGESLWKLITGSHRRQQSLLISQAMRWLSHLTHAEAVGTDYSVSVFMKSKGRTKQERDRGCPMFIPTNTCAQTFTSCLYSHINTSAWHPSHWPVPCTCGKRSAPAVRLRRAPSARGPTV